MQTVRQVRARDLPFMVHPTPIKEHGRPKRYKGLPVYSSCNHIGRGGSLLPHPDAFLFVVVDGERSGGHA